MNHRNTQIRDVTEDSVDRIIEAVTPIKIPLLLDSNEGLISYEQSKLRLIYLGQTLAIVLCLMTTFGMVLMVLVQNDSTYEINPDPKSNEHPLTQNVLIMGKCKNGHIVVLKQMKNMELHFDWDFKVPKTIKIGGFKTLYGYKSECTRGYSVFEDQGEIFVIYLDMAKKITALYSKTKHLNLKSSQIPRPHYLRNSLVKVGNLVWVFGGYSEDHREHQGFWNVHPRPEYVGDCSSVKNGSYDPLSSIWSVDKQAWFDGPTLPIDGCILDAGVVALNRTDVLILIGQPLGSEFYPGSQFYWSKLTNIFFAK